MSKYTTQVRFICESAAGLTESAGFDDVNSIISQARTSIFNFDYPIFDNAYKSVLETKILRHYYTREIGEETVGLWKLRLQQKLNEIMPFYNKLYQSELLEFNPLYDVDLTIDHTLDKTGTITDDFDGTDTVDSETETTGSSNSVKSGSIGDVTVHGKILTETQRGTETHTYNNTHWDYYSDTPQGGVNGLDSGTYLTNARKNTATDSHTIDFEKMSGNTVVPRTTVDEEGGSTNRTTTYNSVRDNVTSSADSTTGTTTTKDDTNIRTLNTTDDYIEHVHGKRGGISYAKMLMEFRETFLNIDKLILDDLKPLFFGLWE